MKSRKSQHKRPKTNNKRNKRNPRSSQRPDTFPLTRLSRYVNIYSPVTPPERDVTFMFVQANVLTNSLAAVANRNYYTNGLYDIDPVIASTATPGLAEYGALYNSYRVVEYEYELIVANREDFAVLVNVLNTVDTFSGSTSLSEYTGNANTTSFVLSRSSGGSATHKFRGRHTVAQIVGSGDVETDDNYVGVVTASNPTRLINLYFGAFTWTGTLTNGIAYNLRLKLHTRLFNRTTVSS